MADDILVQMTFEDIEALAAMYEEHKKALPYLHSFFQACLRAFRQGMDGYVNFYSPNSCWREDGTFFASMKNFGHDIVLHSLDPSGVNLSLGLAKTKRFTFTKEPARDYTIFYAVHENFYSKVERILIEDLKQEVLWADVYNWWCVEKDKALQFESTPPADVYIKELAPEDIQILNNHWPFRWPQSEIKLTQWLKLTKAFGVYLKSTNELASWVASSCLGQMTALQTADHHQKKGYAVHVVKAMAKNLAANGVDCCGTVHPTNKACESLLRKLNFNIIHHCKFIFIRDK